MLILIVAALWCVGHFGLFIFVRGLPRLQTEKGILAFHLFSVAALAVVLILLSVAMRADPVLFLGAFSLHGLYSLTFLELWSLAEGGYTLQLLLRLQAEPQCHQDVASHLASIGEGKRAARQSALIRSGYVKATAGDLALTARGRIARSGIRALRWLSATRAPG